MANVTGKAPTSRDVAREAGVAQSTVSYVLTGSRTISEQTRKRVLEAVDRLGFQPNAGARALAGRRINVLGAVMPLHEGEQDFVASMTLIGALATAARRHKHDLLLASSDEGPAGLARLQGTGICDGVFLLEVAEDDPRLDIVRRDKTPAVIIGVPDDPAGLTCVDLDFELAGAMAVDELANLGHETILTLTPPLHGSETVGYSPRFARGVNRRAAERGVRLHSKALVGTHEDRLTTVRETFEKQPVTGVIIHANISSSMLALQDAGVDVGGTVAVVALGRDEEAKLQRVRLSSISLEPQTVADHAVETMIRRLGTGESEPVVLLVPPRLVRRDSSVPAPESTTEGLGQEET